MRSFFWYFYSNDGDAGIDINCDGALGVLSTAREFIVDMASQRWRFTCYRSYPFKLAALADATITYADRLRVATSFKDTPECCKTRGSCCKVDKLFPNPASLANDKEFIWLLRNWSAQSRVTNMHVERLIASIRRGGQVEKCLGAIDNCESIINFAQ